MGTGHKRNSPTLRQGSFNFTGKRGSNDSASPRRSNSIGRPTPISVRGGGTISNSTASPSKFGWPSPNTSPKRFTMHDAIKSYVDSRVSAISPRTQLSDNKTNLSQTQSLFWIKGQLQLGDAEHRSSNEKLKPEVPKFKKSI